MYEILETEFLAPDVKRFRIAAPRIARKRQAGQFVIVRVHEHGERIPLTIADSAPDGSITIIVQGIGKTTKLLNALEAGDQIRDVVGPLGEASEIDQFGEVAVIGGGVGTAIAYPTAAALHAAGNHVIGIVGARSRELLLLEAEMRAITSELYLMTDDGSYGEHGFVTQKLEQLIAVGRPLARVIAIGPIPMMRAVAEVTRPHGIRTIVSLNPIMVDGTGMCGGCRVIVGGVSRFACVEGPEFDAHEVDFQSLIQRNRVYVAQEQTALAQFTSTPQPDLDEVHSCRLQRAHPDAGPPSASGGPPRSERH